MLEYIIWATDPRNGQERPISEKVFDKSVNEYRVATAIKNGWQNVHTQIIDWGNDNTKELFIGGIKK